MIICVLPIVDKPPSYLKQQSQYCINTQCQYDAQPRSKWAVLYQVEL
ncbi:hypothetical protein W04_3389 [Pseudoalteromonas sp. SW0106-04]|nr:hypothetical protein W04_3389 [Pseudoalteromonas sp. SW0106-04]